MADNQAFIHFTKVTEHLPNAGNHSRHRGFSSELLLLMSSVCTGAQGPLELVKQNENSHLIIESSDAKSQEKLWFHLLHHFTSDKTQGQTTCPKVFVGSEQDFNTSYKGLRHTCHPHAHMPPTPAQPPVLVAVGMTDSPHAVISLVRVWASHNSHDFVSQLLAGSDSTLVGHHDRGCIPTRVLGTHAPETLSSPQDMFSHEATSPRYLLLWLHSD